MASTLTPIGSVPHSRPIHAGGIASDWILCAGGTSSFDQAVIAPLSKEDEGQGKLAHWGQAYKYILLPTIGRMHPGRLKQVLTWFYNEMRQIVIASSRFEGARLPKEAKS